MDEKQLISFDNIKANDPPARRQTVQMVRDGDEVVIEMSRLEEWTRTTVKVIVKHGIATLVIKQGSMVLTSQLAKLRRD